MVEICQGVYWVGAIDWKVRNFHGYRTPLGTTYNAYLLIDEKISLIDTVKSVFAEEMLQRIKEIVNPKDIDYIISNHLEMDHSGAIPKIAEKAKKATIFATLKGKEGLLRIYNIGLPIIAVKEGDEIDLGKRKLRFIETPMVHWPDTMFSYLKEEGILFSSDAFGQHLASSQRFAEEMEGTIVMAEAAKYYANIIMPYAGVVLRTLKKLEGLDIKLIAPGHGVMWRSGLERILKSYEQWSKGETKDKVVIVYDTMWDSTDKMAWTILEGIVKEGGIEVKLYNLSNSDWTEIVKDILDSKVMLVGSPTLNMGMFPTVGGFLTYIKGLRPKGKGAAAFSSYGWSSGAAQAIEKELKEAGIELIENPLTFQYYTPSDESIKTCMEFGQNIARKVRAKV